MEPSDFKFVSENTLDLLALHDCTIERSSFKDGILKLEMDFINVLPEHPLNQFTVAKCTNEALLVFKNLEVVKSIVFDTSEIKARYINVNEQAKQITLPIVDLAETFEIKSVSLIQRENSSFTYYFFRDVWPTDKHKRGEFAEFTIRFTKSLIYWNEFSGDAWFVKGPENTKT